MLNSLNLTTIVWLCMKMLLFLENTPLLVVKSIMPATYSQKVQRKYNHMQRKNANMAKC